MEDYSKIEHLKMIEEVIKRMADNSLSLKKLYIALYSGFTAIIFNTNKDKIDYNIIFIMLCITIIFFFLDVYYLRLEKKYRKLFNEVNKRNKDDQTNNYSMDISDINLIEEKIYKCKYLNKVKFYRFEFWNFIGWHNILYYLIFIIILVTLAENKYHLFF